ncbi:hypothetical protein K461DRAFT_94163 [Myriangium duriaei CBS 260.36]|uniref:Uncharacterized protein n=1 Tax=Myriangium duriaei CBS 260.36 TaxID=1168546 RepID=A0A9P4JA89_9PEZI|nr:hypothetical protein K461DRAFT_94163 [Myriangium duriaei CBS 260.36]
MHSDCTLLCATLGKRRIIDNVIYICRHSDSPRIQIYQFCQAWIHDLLCGCTQRAPSKGAHDRGRKLPEAAPLVVAATVPRFFREVQIRPALDVVILRFAISSAIFHAFSEACQIASASPMRLSCEQARTGYGISAMSAKLHDQDDPAPTRLC